MLTCAKNLSWHTFPPPPFFTQFIFLQIENIIIPSAKGLRKCCRQRLFQHNKSRKMSGNGLINLVMATAGEGILFISQNVFIGITLKLVLGTWPVANKYKLLARVSRFDYIKELKGRCVASRRLCERVSATSRYGVSLCKCIRTLPLLWSNICILISTHIPQRPIWCPSTFFSKECPFWFLKISISKKYW